MGRNLGEAMLEPLEVSQEEAEQTIKTWRQVLVSMQLGQGDWVGKTFEARVLEQLLVMQTYTEEPEEARIAEAALKLLREQYRVGSENEGSGREGA